MLFHRRNTILFSSLAAFSILGLALTIDGRPSAAAEGDKSSAEKSKTDEAKNDKKKKKDDEEEEEANTLPPVMSFKVGAFPQEVRHTFTTANGLPTNNILSVAIDANGKVYAGTAEGLAEYVNGQWKRSSNYEGPVKLIAPHEKNLLGVADGALYLVEDGQPTRIAQLPDSATDLVNQHCLLGGKRVLLGTSSGLFELKGSTFSAVEHLNALLGDDKEVRQVAVAQDGRVAVASAAGLFVSDAGDNWQALYPNEGKKSWAPRDVRSVAFDSQGRLWFASAQGAGRQDKTGWKLFTGREGLPFDDFTLMASGPAGDVWFGTRIGAIHFDGTNWEYRMAPRWLPDNLIRNLAIETNGNAWFATEKGIGLIERKTMTLAEKARFFEEEIDKYNRRTPYRYVLSANLKNPGDKSEWTNHDSDNDGLWTAMYGAGECFAYAATKDPQAKMRATNAFEALRFLSQVTQGGEHPAPPGFPARTILPTSGKDPNKEEHYTPEKDAEQKKKDPQWKVINPRWPTSADGKWYWKTDTSSDELDGHYFMYAVYYDLVAETDEEKARVRDVVVAITDHLIDHGFDLIDHDGKPTRWARFAPAGLNGGETLFQRGLNSLSILSYLKVAEHITGNPKYTKAYQELLRKHGYLANILAAKAQNGQGAGNQSDDEMAFMCYYNLIGYEKDPMLKLIFLWTAYSYWRLEEPEMCPLFNFLFASRFEANPNRQMHIMRMRLPATSLPEAIDTLKRYPLDRIRWPYKNSHRIDIIPLPEYVLEHKGKGHRTNGRVIPIDERSVEHWNHSPWQLDEDGDGKTLTDGAAFLFPYYMGLYYKYIVEG